MIILFSGVSRRADDVIVSESKRLVSLFCSGGSGVDGMDTSCCMLDWSSIAFVTSDRELNYKLRRQSASDSLRSVLQGGILVKSSGNNSFICDSTRFVELLKQAGRDTSHPFQVSSEDREVSQTLQETKNSLRYFTTLQRHGYNPRREKTWERCVQAETFRRSLCRSFSTHKREKQRQTINDDRNPIATKYLQVLYASKEYESPFSAVGVHDIFVPFLGPARLDKKQRRLLEWYNRLAEKKKLPPF
jgi:hypothetical protein